MTEQGRSCRSDRAVSEAGKLNITSLGASAQPRLSGNRIVSLPRDQECVTKRGRLLSRLAVSLIHSVRHFPVGETLIGSRKKEKREILKATRLGHFMSLV